MHTQNDTPTRSITLAPRTPSDQGRCPETLKARVLANPSVRGWVKDAIRSLEGRDPVDAAADAELLARVAVAECNLVLYLQETRPACVDRMDRPRC